MRTDNATYQASNTAESKDPRHVIEIHGDTNTYYILSHSDIVIPGVAAAYIIESSFIKSSVFSQTLSGIKATSNIGKMSFEVLDLGSAVTTMLSDINALDESLRLRKIVYKYGYVGNDYSNYIIIQTQQINDSLTHDGVSYGINARDVMRTAVKKIFTPKRTTLMSSISKTAVQIPAQLVTDFEMITHTASFTDAPSETVGYFRIEDEVMRWTSKDAGTDYFTIDNVASTLNGATTVNATSLAVNDVSGFATSGIGFIYDGVNTSEIRWTGITAASPGPGGTLTGVTGIKYAHADTSAITYSKGRGVFNTVARAYEVDAGITDDDRKPKIEEWIYLEMPALQMYLTIITNTIYGTANTIPAHWGLNTSVDWIATSTFDNIGTDIFDPPSGSPLSEAGGIILRGEGLQTADGKSFLQEEILRTCGVFDYIQADGQIAVKRMDEPLPDAPYVRKLDNSQLVEVESLYYDYNDIYNEFEIFWHWNPITEEYTRRLLLIDQDSINKHQYSKRLTMEFKLLHGSRHTDATIKQLLDRWRGRHAGAPIKGTLKIKHLNNDLEIADICRLDTHIRRDFLGTDTSRLTRSIEIQRITNDPNSGGLKASFMGATEKASPLNLGDQTSVLSAGYYTATGTDLSTVTTYFTDMSGVLHCDTSGYTMAGNASINNSAAHYYVDGDLTIDVDKTLSWTHNVLLKVNGFFTVNGGIEGIGAGLTGSAYDSSGAGQSTLGTAGFFGTTKGGGGLVSNVFTAWNLDVTAPTIGDNSSAPRLEIVNNNGQLEIPVDDLRPSSGGSGQQAKALLNFRNGTYIFEAGGTGGDGGGSLVIVCKGMSFGVDGYIDSSGTAGTYGGSFDHDANGQPNIVIHAGKGASGHPGGVWVLLDGNTVTQPDNKLRAYLQSTEAPGYHIPIPSGETQESSNSSSYFNYLEDRYLSCWNVQRIPDNLIAVDDQPTIATVPTAITVMPGATTTNTINTIALEIGATAPSDTNYRASMLYVREFGTGEDFQRLGQVSSTNEQRVYVPANGVTLEFRAFPISRAGVESTDYIDRIYTVASENDTKVVQGSKVLIGSAIDYFTGNGIALVDDAGTAKAHFGDPSGQYARWTGAAFEIKGTLVAGSDAGGWQIKSNQLVGYDASSPQVAKIWLDSVNQYLAINSTTFGNAGIQVQYNAGAPRFYVGDGSTEYLKYSGGNVEIGGGTLHETVYEVYTSGLIRNNANPSTNGGFQIDNSYFRTWNSASPVNQTFELDFSDGSMTAGIVADEKYIKFDATAGSFKVGRAVEFLNADSYESTSIYINDHASSIAWEKTVFSSNSYATTDSSSAYVGVSSASSASDYGMIRQYRSTILEFVTPTWNKTRRLKVVTKITYPLGFSTAFIGTGSPRYTGTPFNSVGFFFNSSDGNLYAWNANGSSYTETSLFAYSSSTAYKLEIIFTPGTSATFYVNDTLYATHTTNLPSGTSKADIITSAKMDSNGGGYTTYLAVGSIKFIQEP